MGIPTLDAGYGMRVKIRILHGRTDRLEQGLVGDMPVIRFFRHRMFLLSRVQGKDGLLLRPVDIHGKAGG